MLAKPIARSEDGRSALVAPPGLRLSFVGRRDQQFARQLLSVARSALPDADIEELDPSVSPLVNPSPCADVVLIANGIETLDPGQISNLAARIPAATIVWFETINQGLYGRVHGPAGAHERLFPFRDVRAIKDILLTALSFRVQNLKRTSLPTEDDARKLREIALKSKIEKLTPAEKRVALIVGEGKCNKLVAREMSITVRTVKAHLTSIFRKMEITQRSELIYYLGAIGL